MKFYLSLLCLVLLFITGCGSVDYNLIMVKDGDTLPPNICQNVKDKTIIVYKTGCPACGMALPILEEIEKENQLSFKYYDLLIPEERDALLKLQFVTKHVPALIYDCKVYEGALIKENYLKILNVN